MRSSNSRSRTDKVKFIKPKPLACGTRSRTTRSLRGRVSSAATLELLEVETSVLTDAELAWVVDNDPVALAEQEEARLRQLLEAELERRDRIDSEELREYLDFGGCLKSDSEQE